MDQLTITTGLLERLLEETERRCPNPDCQAPLASSTPHLVAVFQPGAMQAVNLIVLCPACHERRLLGQISQAALQAWKIFLLVRHGAGAIPEDLKDAAARNYPGLAPFLPKGHHIFPVAGGRIHLDIGESPMMFARALGRYEPHKMHVIRSLLRPGMTFVDIGANKGDFTLLAAEEVGDAGSVLAIEPEPQNLSWLERSVALNTYRNVDIFGVALGESNEMARLYLGEKSGWHSLLPGQGRDTAAIDVQKRTLDSLLAEIDRPRVHMMKIDVEGGEIGVLQGARRTLTENTDVVLLLDVHPHLGVRPEEVLELLRDLGFSIRRMQAPHEPIVEASPNLTELLALRGASGNQPLPGG